MSGAATRPLRVFHLIKGLTHGGAEMLLLETLRAADREHFTYGYGYLMRGLGPLAPRLEAEGAWVHGFGARSTAALPLLARPIARTLREWRADVVHCHLPLAGVLGRIAGRMAGVPVVYTEHNVWARYHVATRLANRLTWPMQRRVVAVSGEVAASIRATAGDRVPVQTVLNGVDVHRFRPDAALGARMRGELGIPAGAPIVTSVASFKPQKRLDRWLSAAALLLDARPDVRFLLLGNGPEQGALEAQVAALGIGHAVRFAGLQGDVRPWLACTDLYMMSSDFEGLPVALLEAMASGCAVVTTAVGGIPELIVSGTNGELVASDPGALADAARALLEQHERRRALGDAARATVVERFSIARMAAQLEALYAAVAAPAPATSTTPAGGMAHG